MGVRPETENLLSGIELHHPPLLTDISSTKIRDARAEDVRFVLHTRREGGRDEGEGGGETHNYFIGRRSCRGFCLSLKP